MKIIQVNGNEKRVSALLFDKESNSYYFLFASGKWHITSNSDDCISFPYSPPKRSSNLIFNFFEENGTLFQIIKLNSKDSYSDMRKLWEIINEDN